VSGRVTIKSIAQDLGLSHMTVSRALSGHSNVHAETRHAVLERARTLGYVKSAAASALRGDATRIVGLLLPNLVNEFYAQFADTMARACEEQALHLVIHLTNDDELNERQAILRLREVQASAVVMVPTPVAGSDAPTTIESMRVVQLIRKRDFAPALLIDDAAAIADAVNHLVGRGHRSIGFIGANLQLSSGRERFFAFRDSLQRHGIAMLNSLTITASPSFRMGYESVSALLDGKETMTALVCGGFEISNGALDACLERDLRFPNDLAFVGYGDPAAYRWIAGGITTIRLPVAEMANGAVRSLTESLQQTREPQSPQMFSATLVTRRST
jgi:DNA-binding LacI/PurR family transcriptional regulator